MLMLDNVTMICVDCVNVERAVKSMEVCLKHCIFDDVKLLTSLPTDYKHAVKIDPINSINEYSQFVLKRIHEYVNTRYMLIVQYDGYIVNPDNWKEEYKKYDYIGALIAGNIVGNGGFSFRTKKLMLWLSENPIDYNGYVNEDGVICIAMREKLVAAGFKFATPEIAKYFSHEDIKDPNIIPFGVHARTLE